VFTLGLVIYRVAKCWRQKRTKGMLLRLKFEICLSTGAEFYIYGLDKLPTLTPLNRTKLPRPQI